MPLRVVRKAVFVVLAAAVVLAVFANAAAQESATQEILVVRGARMYPISGTPTEHGILVVMTFPSAPAATIFPYSRHQHFSRGIDDLRSRRNVAYASLGCLAFLLGIPA